MTFLLSPSVMRAWLQNVLIREGVFASSTTIAFRCNLCYGIVPVNMSVVRSRLRQSSLNKSHAWKVSSSLLPRTSPLPTSRQRVVLFSLLPTFESYQSTKRMRKRHNTKPISEKGATIQTLSQQVTQEVQGGGAWRTATFI